MGYTRLVDSADFYIDDDSVKSLAFLDSIPKPIEKSISGRLADYYSIKALLYQDFREYPLIYQSYILALKYAKKEENYRVAGESCLELFSMMYFIEEDKTSYNYLEEAKKFFNLSDYKNGLVEVEQMHIYIKFLDGEYQECNDLLLKNLESYQAINDDAYFYMFALYMLASNYVYLDEIDKAHFYFNKLKALKSNPTIAVYNNLSFEVAVNTCFADVYFDKKQIDSTLYYLNKSSKLNYYMGEDVIADYYKLNINTYEFLGKKELAQTYSDSLAKFENNLIKNIFDASLEINNVLLKTESELEAESNKKYLNGILVVILFSVLAMVSLWHLIFYRKQKFASSNFSYLKSNHEKLKLKIHGLEEYITEVKKEVKSISTIDEVGEQQTKIKELYKNVHLNTSTVLSKEEDHAELINEHNVDFFTKLSSRYPELNDSEIVICYYLFTGFKSKEIAVFLGSSIRAVESKRYRIRKKLNIQERGITLTDFFEDVFKKIKIE